MRLAIAAIVKLAAEAQYTDKELIKALRDAADAIESKGMLIYFSNARRI